jgi:hypothetical protein
MSKMRPYKPEDSAAVVGALHHLRAARDLLRAADCPKAASYVQRAIKSAEGAKNHMWRREVHQRDREIERLRAELDGMAGKSSLEDCIRHGQILKELARLSRGGDVH